MPKTSDIRRSSDYERPYVLAIDIGSSSVRAALYDAGARRIQGTQAQAGHELHITSDGGAVESPEHLVEHVEEVVDAALEKAGEYARHIAAVGMDAMASTVLGLDADGKPLTPIYTYADTRPSREAEELKRALDVEEVYQRTGCPQHTSYLPARFRWLQRTSPEIFEKARLWVDVGTYLYTRWFGGEDVPMSYSMASWTGLLDRRRLQWDGELLRHLSVSVEALPPLAGYSGGQAGLTEPFASRWPHLRDVPFYLAVGDGASANVGSGCVSSGKAALTIGTSGALRLLLEDEFPEIPQGLWGYRLGGNTLMGGSFSDGGSVFAWAGDTLRLSDDAGELDGTLRSMTPDGHGLTVLPFLSGERSPGWATKATGTIAGLRMSTTPAQILQAALESVAYRFGMVWDLLSPYASDDVEIIASGGAITRSGYWLQLMADMLQCPVVTCIEEEATSRGTAMLALKAQGVWQTLDKVPARLGDRYSPNPKRAAAYQKGRDRQRKLYDLIIGQEFS